MSLADIVSCPSLVRQWVAYSSSAMSTVTNSYVPRRPEDSVLHKVVRENVASFFERLAAEGRTLPSYVERELMAFLDCNVLALGFVRLRCEDCGEERFLAFSCKCRGFCPACGGRRMAEAEAHLLDEVFPEEDVRQWVVTLPFTLRFWAAADRQLLNKTITLVQGAISAYLKKRAFDAGLENPQTGAVLFIQRAGGSLNLNPHFHFIFLEGAYETPAEGSVEPPKFHPLPPPSDEDVAKVLQKIANKVIRMLRRKGLLKAAQDGETEESESVTIEEGNIYQACLGASIIHHVATGDRAGLPVRRIGRGFGFEGEEAKITGRLCATVNGFSIHAATHVKGHQRGKLARLVRYVARPPAAAERFSLTADGNVLFSLKSEWSDGTTALLFSPQELLEKLAAIIPPPRGHLTRYFGILGPCAEFRAAVVPAKAQVPDSVEPKGGWTVSQKRTMAILLKRTFGFDLEICSRCAGKMKRISIISDPAVACAMLNSVRLPADSYRTLPARPPPELPPYLN